MTVLLPIEVTVPGLQGLVTKNPLLGEVHAPVTILDPRGPRYCPEEQRVVIYSPGGIAVVQDEKTLFTDIVKAVPERVPMQTVE
jgi:hypothetical protein